MGPLGEEVLASEWATTKEDPTPSLPKVQVNTKPISRDQCGFTIQLSPINRFEPSPRHRKHGFDFCAFKYGNSMLKDGIVAAK